MESNEFLGKQRTKQDESKGESSDLFARRNRFLLAIPRCRVAADTDAEKQTLFFGSIPGFTV